MTTTTTVFGIKLEIVIIILLVLIVILAVLLAFTIRNLIYIDRKYYSIMQGKKGKDLEKIILTRFTEMDKVKLNAKRLNKEHREIKSKVTHSYSKLGLIKYNAFDELTGELSYSFALLNDENSGIVINSVYSKQGCYTFAKEIIKGESYIPLSEEEKKAIEKAKTVDEEIKKMTEIKNEDENFDED